MKFEKRDISSKEKALRLNQIAKNLILNRDYRTEQNEYIEAKFLDSVITFFKDIVEAKLNNKNIDIDWYKEEFLNKKPLDINVEEKKMLALMSGLNMKTINNIKGTTKREVVVDFANEHYDILRDTIGALIETNEITLELKLTYNDVSVNLDSEETLLVINVLTIIRSHLRGGAWSSLGKRIETPLMLSYVKLLNIAEKNYIIENKPDTERETDFFFVDDEKNLKAVEIKLMGEGNPESADGAIARDVDIFFAYELSDSNKKNLTDNQGIHYVEFSGGNTVKKLESILDNYNINYTSFEGDLESNLDEILGTK